MCVIFYSVPDLILFTTVNIGIPVPKQHLWLTLLVAWWWPVNRSKHV